MLQDNACRGRLAVIPSSQVSRTCWPRATSDSANFAADELDLDLGDLKASLVWDFILREAGPSIYNLALEDAGRYFAEKVEELPGRHLKEFGYFAR